MAGEWNSYDQEDTTWDTTDLGKQGGDSFTVTYDAAGRAVTIETPGGAETFTTHDGEHWRAQAERELAARGYGNRWTRWEQTDDGQFTMSAARRRWPDSDTPRPNPATPQESAQPEPAGVWVPSDDGSWEARPVADDSEPGRVRVFPQYSWPVYGGALDDAEQKITVTDWRKEGQAAAQAEATRQIEETLGSPQDTDGTAWWLGPARKDTFRWNPPKGTPRNALPVDPVHPPTWNPTLVPLENPPAGKDLREKLRDGEISLTDWEEAIPPAVQQDRYADRLAHQREHRGPGTDPAPGYTEHAAGCGTCQDLDAGGDGIGRRLRVTTGPPADTDDDLYPVKFTFTGGAEAGDIRHHAFETAADALHTHIATWRIPDDLTGVLDTDSFIASIGPFIAEVGAALTEVAQKLGGGQTPVAPVVAEVLEEFATSLQVMSETGAEVHTEWQNNPENAHDLARAHGDIPNAHLFNVQPEGSR